jgi:hypothetical protein
VDAAVLLPPYSKEYGGNKAQQPLVLKVIPGKIITLLLKTTPIGVIMALKTFYVAP